MAGSVEDIDYEVEKLLDSRATEQGGTEYLVRWRGFGSDWDTWEPEGNIANCGNIIKKFHASTPKPKISKKRGKYKEKVKVYCKRCEFSYASAYLFERHLRTDNCRHECHLCGRVFLHHRRHNYHSHLKSHARQVLLNAENKDAVTLKPDTKSDKPESHTEAVGLKPAKQKALQKKPKAASVKVVSVKGQRKVKLVRNKNKSAVTDKGKSKTSSNAVKKELIAVDDEVSLSILRDKFSEKIAQIKSEKEREAFVSSQMSEIFESVLSSTDQEESKQKVDKDKKRQSTSGNMDRKKKMPVRRTRSVGAAMSPRKFRPRPVDKDKSLNTDVKESQGSASSFKKPLKQKDALKSKKATLQKAETVETSASDKDVKKMSPKSNKSEKPSSVKKKVDTSKLDELFNHLMEQVRAATPPTKPSKHTVMSVKNVLKSGKPKVPSPKSSPVKSVKSNKATSSQAVEPQQAAKDLKGKKDNQATVQIIRVGMPKGSKLVDNKEKGKTKTMKAKGTKNVTEQPGKRKPLAGQKRKASGDVVIETDESNSDDDVLYSLSDMEDNDSTPTQSPKDVRKKSSATTSGIGEKDGVKAKNKKAVKVVKSQSESGVEKSPNSKKMRLLDSLTKPAVVKPVRPVSPTPLFTTVKTAAVPPTTTTNARKNIRAPGGIPMYQYVIQPSAAIPISPTSMSYKTLLENLPHQLHPKKNKNKSDNGEEDVERRVSVRSSECAFKYKEIIVKKCQKYTQIWLYTHTKMKNSLNPQVILELQSALNAAKYDDSNLVMLSGLDNVFCSGIDLHFLQSGDKKVAARQMVDALRDFTKTLITFPKLIVAVVTGPAIGLGMTMLPLCDVVYASDKATFYLPYAQLDQTPEGCASYTLPQALGMAMANELLIGGRKITAIEACQLGLVSQVYWPTSMMQEVIPRVQNMAQTSGKVLETTKLLVRSHQRTKLDLTNESETNLLLERWTSTECQQAISEFLDDEKNYTF